MLVLSRKQNDEILIGDSVCIKVVGVFGNRVRLGISAPADVVIRRGELDFFGRGSDQMPDAGPGQTIDFRISSSTNETTRSGGDPVRVAAEAGRVRPLFD